MSGPDDIFGSSPSQESGDSFGGSDADQAMRDHDEALAQLRADRKLTQLLASQEAERASAPSNQSALFPTDQFSMGASAAPHWMGNYVHPNPFGSAASSARAPLWTGAQPTHQLLKYGIVPFSSQYDAELNPADDWQQRGRDTAAMALSILYPHGGLPPVAAKQGPDAGDGFQPFPPRQPLTGIQPAALSTTSGAPTNGSGQAPQSTNGARALSQMRTDPAWQQEMKNRPNEDFVPWMYDARKGKGDYTIGYGHQIKNVPEFSDYLGKTISRGEGEALFQRDLATAEDVVRRKVIQPLTQNQFDALVDFVFQAGEGSFTNSDIYTYTNLGDYPAAQGSFANTNAGISGVYNRRLREAKKFGAP